MAIGYVLPPRRSAEWCAMGLLDQALHGGRAGRIHRNLVLEKQIAVEADGGVDDIFGYNGPAQMTTKILYKPEISAAATVAAFDAIIQEIQEKGITADELEQLKIKWRSDYYTMPDDGRGGHIPKNGLIEFRSGLSLFYAA